MSTENSLLLKIKEKNAAVGIIGLGYVGLPLGVEFALSGYNVKGFDLDQKKITSIKDGISYIKDVLTEELSKVVKSGNFSATTNFDELSEMDAIIICVPTPLRKTKDPDISYVVSATKEIAKRLRKEQIIVLESTTYPGTTEELIKPQLEETGLIAGKDFFLAFSPERVDPGNKNYKTKNTPKLIGGLTKNCLELTTELYKNVMEKIVPVSSPKVAEMAKILENTFRAINIGLANETAIICDKLDINVWEVIDAAATKPFGFMPFYPGPGLGGHCIPIDPQYLSWKLKYYNYNARFIEIADEINSKMPEYVVQKIADALNTVKKPINGSKILILGVAYKPDISDLRESPALDIISLLSEKNAEIFYNDPYVPEFNENDFSFKSTNLDNLDQYDIVIIATNHSSYDYNDIFNKSKLIFDTRNALKNLDSEKIFRI